MLNKIKKDLEYTQKLFLIIRDGIKVNKIELNEMLIFFQKSGKWEYYDYIKKLILK